MNVPRETICDAVLALLATAQLDGQPAFVTTSRKFVQWDQVSESQQPAQYLVEGSEHASEQNSYGETKWRMRLVLWVYCLHSPETDVPGTLLNNLLDSVEAAIMPPPGQTQTLGGLVANCYIDGEVLKSVGNLPDDVQSIAVVPFTIETGI